MITDDKEPVNPILLAIPVVILLNVHLFTFIIAIFSLFPFFIVGMLKVKNKTKMLLNTCIAILITTLLSARLITAIIEIYATNTITKPYPVEKMMNNVMQFSISEPGWMKLGFIFSTLFIFMFVITVFYWKNLSIVEKNINCVGLIFLLLSSNLLPWDDIPRIFKLIQDIQFPQRFINITFVLLILGFTLFLQRLTESKFKIKTIILTVFLTITIFSCININKLIADSSNAWHSGNPISTDTNATKVLSSNPNEIKQAYSGSKHLGQGLQLVVKLVSDYLPTKINAKELWKKKPYDIYWHEIVMNHLNIKKTISKKKIIQLTWINDRFNQKETLLPIIAYNRSELWLNGKKLISTDYKTSNIGSVIIKAKKGKNVFEIGYKPSKIFSIARYMQTVSYLILCIYLLIILIKKCKKQS
ncbi:hypothetical protein MEPL4_3c02610 [Melissococcus plutonius]|uniref:cell division protein n=1 Tax=Melissococcus plutonius TaxID=33970 RepID=UPI00065F3867|nr:cell division protein [Melissococcus plutonius]AKQ32798.1 hypothetical protein MEPL_c005230 [Melissococcus plutonius S1]KMT24737.1 hypothetical protein MEPL2_2c02700 [Melissococcus plutonius]KMT26374.1 hypothetical protein MEPL3_2c00330 [Melissococcus plutonius]KMT27624.1 hypothetical protein MEPL1_3c02630 [Melissococcus plutonius]KMT29396.1 hypothetical protein MEPL4_3c02610 [Melissococcus plutonius]